LTPHSQSDLDSRTEPVQNSHKPVDGEPPEVRVPDAGEVRRRDAGAAVGGPDGVPFPVERLDDFGGQDGLEPLGIRILAGSGSTALVAIAAGSPVSTFCARSNDRPRSRAASAVTAEAGATGARSPEARRRASVIDSEAPKGAAPVISS
jgi:hypothetical protein